MPNATLIALTAPLLLGQAPLATLAASVEASRDHTLSPVAEPVSAVQAPLLADRARSTQLAAASVLSLQWSLTAKQTAPQTSKAPPTEEESGEPQEETEGQIVVEGSYGPPKTDPIERVNEESYRITQKLDETFVEPIAYAYRDGLPDPLRDGLGNVVKNLGEPNNALNFLLQGKFGKTFETLGRMMINSTLGLGGLIDIAEKPGIGLPYRRNGFANTMGFYGVGSGPYLYLPLTGATSARDVIGSGLDQLLLPVAVGRPFNRPEYTVPFYIVSNLDARLEVDAELERIGETINPYAARRDSYLYRRAKTIAELRGEEPPEPPLILEEVEGTGEFADPPADEAGPSAAAQGRIERPAMAVIITRPR